MPSSPPSTATKHWLLKLAQLIAQGYSIALEMRRYQTIYLLGGGHERVLELKRARQQRQWRDALRQLKHSGYVNAKATGHRLIIGLTSKGERALLVHQLAQAPRCQPGHGVIVSFDIPETAKVSRNYLRSFLRQTGFRQMQKSVWWHEREVIGPLRDFIQQRRLTHWVSIFRAEVVPEHR